MTVKEFYESIHCDYQAALRILMMDNFIKKMLGKFIANNSASELFEAYEKKDYKGVFAAAHSFKGVAGNLALTTLYNKVIPIVEATRGADGSKEINIDDEINDLKNEYDFVVKQIQTLINS